jgi:hypothetical protein
MYSEDTTCISSLPKPFTGSYKGTSDWLEKPISALGYITAIVVCDRGLSIS